MTMHTDDYIERWTNIYQANPVLRAHCVLLESFLQMPEYYLNHYIFKSGNQSINSSIEGENFLPLLESQRAVMIRVIQHDRARPDPERIESYLMARVDCRISDGRYIEPLHHHSYRVTSMRRNL